MQVRRINDKEFEVSLEGPPATKHLVTLSEPYHRKLTQGRITREELITYSFEFLLERESNTSILRSFDLPLIGRYFPEYEQDIKRRLE
jgi:hypothetical protein